MIRKVCFVLCAVILLSALCGCSKPQAPSIEVVEEVVEQTEVVKFAGWTPDRQRVIFANEEGEMWSLNNYYAEPSDTFVITLHNDKIIEIEVIE